MNNRTSRVRRLKRFTLLELLITVAVIAILFSLLLPALGKVREKVQATLCVSNVRQCLIGIQNYCSDYNGILNCYVNQASSDGPAYGSWGRLFTVGTSYLNPKVVYCPRFNNVVSDTNRTQTYGMLNAGNGWTWAWLDTPAHTALFGSGIYYKTEPDYGFHIRRIKSPTRFPLLADTYSPTGRTGVRTYCPGTASGDYKASLHHVNRGTIGYVDGHAGSEGLEWFRSMSFSAVIYEMQVYTF